MNLANLEALMFKAFAAGFVSLVVSAGVIQFKPASNETVQLERVVVTAADARNS